jgi:hypothetical protein
MVLLAGVIGASPTRAAGSDDDPPATTVLRVPLNDTLTPGNLARLTANSATARDLLARIERVPDAILIVRAHPLLVKTERLLGRGQFWVVRGRLFGLLEYQAEPAGSHRALRILAHELAHALEVGMLPRSGETEALRSLLRVRELDEGFDLAPGIETDFARAVSHRVHLEMRGRLPNTPDLLARAAAAHVTLPPLPGDEAAGGR